MLANWLLAMTGFTPSWCPEGFEVYTRFHMKCGFSTTGQVVAWQGGSLEDKLDLCLRRLDEDRINVDRACRAGLTRFWSMGLRRIIDLRSESSGHEFIKLLSEQKKQLECDLQSVINLEVRNPSKF